MKVPLYKPESHFWIEIKSHLTLVLLSVCNLQQSEVSNGKIIFKALKIIEASNLYLGPSIVSFIFTVSSLHFTVTADRDYIPGPYTVSFSAGQQSDTLLVSTMEDNVVELSELFTVLITSVDKPDVVKIGSPNISSITIEDNGTGNMKTCDTALHVLIIVLRNDSTDMYIRTYVIHV